jgi:hypothetical protein
MNGSNLMSEHQQSGLVVNWPLSVQALIMRILIQYIFAIAALAVYGGQV